MAQAQPATIDGGARHVVAVLSSSATPAVPPFHKVFDQLLVEALQAHPSVRSALSQANGAKLDVDVAKWAFWPTMSFNSQRTDAKAGQLQGSS